MPVNTQVILDGLQQHCLITISLIGIVTVLPAVDTDIVAVAPGIATPSSYNVAVTSPVSDEVHTTFILIL